MATPDPAEVTVLLKAWGGGDQAALDRLAPVVYDELRRIARHYMRNRNPPSPPASSRRAGGFSPVLRSRARFLPTATSAVPLRSLWLPIAL